MTTFPVSTVEVSRRKLTVTTPIDAITAHTGQKPEASASNLPNLTAAKGNPFIGTVTTAFAQHYPLTLSHDDVWLCIAQGFEAR